MSDPASQLANPEASDAVLISRIRAGDVAAYGLLYERHLAAARGLARHLIEPDAAEDAVQETFAKLLDVLRRGGGPQSAFRPYLLTAVRRTVYDRYRGDSRVTTTDEIESYDPGEPFVDPALQGLERSMIAQAFRSLPERWQAVLWHTEIEGQKPAEVAPLLGLTANGVAALAYRAREGLRQAYLQMHLATPPADAHGPVLAKLGAYIRGGLGRREGRQVERHLDECDDCRAVYAEIADVNTTLRTAIGPLVLGTAATAYLAATKSGAGAAAGGLLGWLRHLPKRQQILGGGAVAGAAVAAVTATALLLTSGDETAKPVRKSPSPPIAAPPIAPPPPVPPAPLPPGSNPPGATPPGSVPPGSIPPGAVPPGSVPPGSNPPGALPPGARPPGFPSPGPVQPGTPPPGSSSAPAPSAPRSPAQPPAKPRPPRNQPADGPPKPRPPKPKPAPSTSPRPPAKAVRLTARIGSVGALVRDHPGIVALSIANTGAADSADMEADVVLPPDVSYSGGTTGRLAVLFTPLRQPGGGWSCRPLPTAAHVPGSVEQRTSAVARDGSAVRCTHGPVASGATTSAYLHVDVGGSAPYDTPPTVTLRSGALRISARGEEGVMADGLPARFAADGNLRTAQIGNSLLSCDESQPECGRARDRQGDRRDNDLWRMGPLDLDDDPATKSSSSARLELPAGDVLWAGLYWSGSGMDDEPITAKVAAPGAGSYELIRPERVERDRLPSFTAYQAFADVTKLVREHRDGQWWVADVPTETGTSRYAGWSLVVVAADPAAPARRTMVLDGAHALWATTPRLEVPLGGLLAAAEPATIGLTVWEGDADLNGDQVLLDQRPLTPAEGDQAADNVFDGSATGATGPRLTFGVDVDMLTAVLGDRHLLTFTTRQDAFLTGVVTVTAPLRS